MALEERRLNSEQRRQLVDAARKTASHAHCPHSGFEVGAAVLTATGQVYSGCNVESASYGLTCCAERAALVGAVSAGVRPGQVTALVVYTPGKRAYSPCGACRQMISELMPPDAPIASICDGDEQIEWTVADCLPRPFRL
jgi:cytidine deaminase